MRNINISKHGKTWKAFLAICTIIPTLQGCGLFVTPCGAACKAEFICNDLNKAYTDKHIFTIAKNTSEDYLVRTRCNYREGLILKK